MSEEASHYLGPYLETTLPNLGLDYETYGPYITGLFPLDNSDGRNNVSSSSDDAADIEGMDDIIELLQSSSETHGDDDDAWITFKKEIIQRKNDYEFNESVRQQGEALSRQKIAEEKARNALLTAKEEDEKTYNKKIEQQLKSNQHQRHLNAALIEQYGYENDESTTTDNKKNKDDGDVPINDNRQNAIALEKARTANVRYEANKSHQSKQAAREATNKMKADKLKAKEDRRKRTAKGERRRG